MTDSAHPPPIADDPLLTSRQAADHMGKTYTQFTAYASHHKLPREGEGRGIRYRLSVLDKALGVIAGPLAVINAEAEAGKADKTDEGAAALPALFHAALADRDRQIARIEGQIADRDRRIEEKNALLLAMAEEKGAAVERARQAEQRAADLLAQMERQTKQTKALTLWQKLFGGGVG